MSTIHALFATLPKAHANGKDLVLHILHMQIAYWVSFGHTQADISIILDYEETHIHHCLDWLYPAFGCCDKAGFTRRTFELELFVIRNGITMLNPRHLKKCMKLMNEKEAANTKRILDDISKRLTRKGKSNWH